MPNTTNINIIFRTKFKKQIKCDAEHDVFLDAFKKFINLEPETAINMLWQLTYEPYSEVLWEIGLYPESIAEEMTSVLRNELRYQYEEHHPNFLSIEVGNECSEAFTALSNQADPIVARVVYVHCCSHLFVQELEMARMLFLLGSDKENQFYGGIRSLRFSMQEADYLKPFHKQIHDLLKAMYELHQKQNNSSPLNTPFEDLAQMIEESGNDVPFDWECTPCVAPPVPAESTFKALTHVEVLEHKDVFASFVGSDDLNQLVQIGELGFDLNEVMAKKEKISILLIAAEAKEEADANLLKASEALSA